MKRIALVLLMAIALLQLTFMNIALATEISTGAKIFSTNCSSCHIGGGNILLTEKTLKREALSKYLANFNINSLEAIIYQVQNGKNAMPAFKSKLSAKEIIEVATYVLQKAEQGW